MSPATPSQASPSAPALPTEPHKVTLEISDRLPSHLIELNCVGMLARWPRKGDVFVIVPENNCDISSPSIEAVLLQNNTSVLAVIRPDFLGELEPIPAEPMKTPRRKGTSPPSGWAQDLLA
ncbi:unnamed protein product [Pleuronectes platessa]|uniref:Uncharacterized protein n=1 Tax=Pleuronectes platessa TaxID=8262 RepID=A0A9N7Y8Y0_PLEPL|nr:unnamed protein product [Pleuronectes platessa]